MIKKEINFVKKIRQLNDNIEEQENFEELENQLKVSQSLNDILCELEKGKSPRDNIKIQLEKMQSMCDTDFESIDEKIELINDDISKLEEELKFNDYSEDTKYCADEILNKYYNKLSRYKKVSSLLSLNRRMLALAFNFITNMLISRENEEESFSNI